MDALIETKVGGAYIGFQFTRLNYQEETDGCTMQKSKLEIILRLGFALIACIYLQDELVGVGTLLPTQIQMLEGVEKDFAQIRILTFGSFYKTGIAAKVFYPNMNLWIREGKLVQGEKF